VSQSSGPCSTPVQSSAPVKAALQSRARHRPGAPAVAALGRRGHARSQAARQHTQVFSVRQAQHNAWEPRASTLNLSTVGKAWAEGCRCGRRAVEVAGRPLSSCIASLWAASPASSGVLVQGARDASLKCGTQCAYKSTCHSMNTVSNFARKRSLESSSKGADT